MTFKIAKYNNNSSTVDDFQESKLKQSYNNLAFEYEMFSNFHILFCIISSYGVRWIDGNCSYAFDYQIPRVQFWSVHHVN